MNEVQPIVKKEPTLKEELASAIKEGQDLVNPPNVVKLPDPKGGIAMPMISKPDIKLHKWKEPMETIVPIERYNHRDVRKALRADKKRAAKGEEYKLVKECQTDHQRDTFFRMKLSEERKQLMTYIFMIIITWIGGVTALAEVIKAAMSGGLG